MRLTKDDKELFVTRVMDDVPSIDFDAQLTKSVQEDVLRTASPGMLDALKCTEVRDLLYSGGGAFYPDRVIHGARQYSYWDVGLSGVATPGNYKPSDLGKHEHTAIMLAAAEQHAKRTVLRQQLDAAIGACSTRKKAVERLPEFEKYLPEEASKTENLPALANLTAELIQAGWPKGK